MVIKINYTSSDIYVSTNVSPVYVVVNYSSVNNGGGVAWGAITGTLSDQTDLQNAIDDLVPYSGATGNVDLGEYELKAGQVEFDQTPTGAAGVGVMRWNDSDGTVDLGLKGGNVTLQVGQEQVLRVVNKTGADLLESQYRAVRIRLVSEGGSQGQRLAVVLAQGDNDPDSTTTIGIVTETIANNQEGFITTSGEVRGINTTGSLQGETWLDGDIIYLSPTIAGGITKVKPTAPDHMVVLGYVIYAHANNGKIFVKVDNGYELGELHDVYVPSPSNNDSIFWNTANSRYQNNSITGVLGYTPVPTTRTLTINGTAYDLSADRSWTVSGSATPAGANTQIQYNNSGVFGASAGLTYDDSTGLLSLTKNQNAPTYIQLNNSNNNSASGTYINMFTSGSAYSQISKLSQTGTASAPIAAGDFYLYNSNHFGDITIFNGNNSGKIKFSSGGASTAQMTLTAAGRLLLGTVSESTFLLDVNGTARVSGDAIINTLNIGLGGGALSQNTRVGVTALNANTTGQSNSAFGFNSLRLNTTGLSNSAFGSQTLSSSLTTVENTAIGNSALRDLTTGNTNVAVGSGSMLLSTNANANTAIGYFAYSKGTGSSNTSVGINSMANATTGGNNSAYGNSSMNSAVTGNFNNAFGVSSMGSLTSGEQNTAIGNSALFSNTTGSNNTAIGRGLQSNTTGSNNIALGWTSGFYNTTESNQLYIGSLFFASLAESKTNSIIYGVQNATAANQILRLNASTGIGLSANPVASAQLQVDSTNRGFLPPRMTTTQKNAIGTPAAGLMVFDTTLVKLCVYNGTAWETITSI